MPFDSDFQPTPVAKKSWTLVKNQFEVVESTILNYFARFLVADGLFKRIVNKRKCRLAKKQF